MKNPVLPIIITLLSLIVIGASAFLLHGPIHPDYLPRSPYFAPPLQPVVLKGLREYYLIPAVIVTIFGLLAIAHARAARLIKWLYVAQMAAGTLFLVILVASGLRARSLFLNGPPPPIWVGSGEPPESVKSRMK